MATPQKKAEDYFDRLHRERFESQEEAVQRAVNVLRESTNQFRELKGAKKSRHKTAFRILSDLLKRQDQNQARIDFVYCSCCFSPSQLGSITDGILFVEDFQKWTQSITFPATFLTTVEQLYRQHQVILDQYMQHAAKRKRSEDESLAAPAEKRQACMPTSPDSGSDDEGLGHKAGADLVDGPFNGPVYELKAVDVIRAAIAEDNEKPGFKLTMPDFPGQSPFITFSCPENLANALLQKRQQIL